jgi:hypothetical protein
MIRTSTSTCCRVLPWERRRYVATFQGAVVLSENPPGRSVLGAAGWPAPGREPRKGCLKKRLFPSGNPQLPSVLGSAGWFRHQGASPGVFGRCLGLWVAMGCLWVASPPPLSPYETRSPRRPMWSYTGFPLPGPPLQVVIPRIRSHEAISRSALLQMPNSVYPSTYRYPVTTDLPR